MLAAGNFHRDRFASVVAVAVLHVAVGYALLTGAGVTALAGESERLKVFDVAVPAPPPPQQDEAPEPEGEAAPPALEARPSAILAPPPRVQVEQPVAAAPVAGPGAEATTGAAPVPGPGTGAGGGGAGTGSGGSGSGAGGGGAASRPRLLSGRIVNADYPRAAYRARAEGTVTVSYWVGVDGRASRCRTVRSSGHAELDAATCRLVVERYRYEPARNAAGEAIPYLTGWQQRWWIGAD